METAPKEILYYQKADGEIPFWVWFNELRDMSAKANILKRVERASAGNLGNCDAVGDGVTELRIHVGPGYRVYLGQHGGRLIVILSGGDKNTQKRDIRKAKEYWRHWRESQR